MRNINIPLWRITRTLYDGSKKNAHPFTKQRIFPVHVLRKYNKNNKRVKKLLSYF